jgi:hypothetical protein
LIESDDLYEEDPDANNSIELETFGDVIAVLTEFDQDGSRSDSSVTGPDGKPITPYESQAVVNDSGGAMFYKEKGKWVLGGMIIAVGGFPDQPNVTRTALFGNYTFALDLPEYREFVTEHFIVGDFDDDLALDAGDIDLLSAAVRQASSNGSFDLNRDASVDQADRKVWVEELRRTFFGDADLDGQFNSGDLVDVFVAGQYEDSLALNSTWKTGDWNGDGDFTSSDFVLALQADAFEKGPRTDAAVPFIVPEPSGILPLASLLLLLCRRTLSKHALTRNTGGVASGLYR